MEKEVIDPWKIKEVKDYQSLSQKFGIKSFKKFKKHFPENRYLRRNIMFGHRDFGKIFKAIQEKRPWVMMTGLMPSGKFHLGHKMVAEEIIWFQKLGAEIYICCADLESYLIRNISLKKAREIAKEEYLKNYVALGLKEKNLTFWFQSKYKPTYYRLQNQFSKKVTFNELKAIYGSLSPGKILSVLLQVADILHPQLPEFGGPKPTVVPVGVDQDPHIRLTRDLASRFKKEYNFVLPSSTYHKFSLGLKGGKMSSSDPSSYIALTDPPEKAAKKIRKYAFSGGQATLKEHKEKGGNPEVDVAFQMLRYEFEEDDEKLKQIYKDYKSGKLLTGELKEMVIEKLTNFLKEHQRKLKDPKIEKKVEKILEDKC